MVNQPAAKLIMICSRRCANIHVPVLGLAKIFLFS